MWLSLVGNEDLHFHNPQGIWCYVENEQGYPQAVGVYFRPASIITQVVNYAEQGQPGWYWVATTSTNTDLTCCISSSCVTHNTDELIGRPEQPPRQYLVYTIPPIVLYPDPDPW
jgi:hypothetical protein